MHSTDRLLHVKNTFIDIDDDPEDLPAPPCLRRVKTEPGRQQQEEGLWPELDSGSDMGEFVPPEAPELYRTATFDGYEPVREWEWAGRDAVAVMEQMGAPPPAPEMTGGAAALSGIMMVPSTMLLPGVGFPVEGMASGCVAVPVDRFNRWPGGGLPPPPAPPAPPPTEAAPVLSRVISPGAPPAAPPGASATSELARSEPSPPPCDQPALQRAFSVNSSIFRVHWTVSARKLKSKDRFAVSPDFQLSFKVPAEFKMVIHPTETSDLKGGKSFISAKGKGRVELKCETCLDNVAEAVVRYRIWVGGVGEGATQLKPRGPKTHDFAKNSVSGLSSEEEEWDFTTVVDEGSTSFIVCLEVLPAGLSSS